MVRWLFNERSRSERRLRARGLLDALLRREDFTSSVGMALRRFERRGVLEITEKNARTVPCTGGSDPR